MLNRIFSSLIVAWRRRGTNGSSTIAAVVAPLLLLALIGTFSYRALEGWTLLDSLYATIITITTVGYGDVTPVTPGGRLFSVFFTLGAIGLASYAISTLAATVIDKQSRRIAQRIRRLRMQQIADLNNHTIICGATIVGQRAGVELMRRGEPFVLIEADEAKLRYALLWMNPDYVDRLRRQFASMELADFESFENRDIAELAQEIGVLYLHADPMSEGTLLQAGLQRAKGVMTALDDDLDNIAIILSARDMVSKLSNHALRIVSRVSEVANIRRVYLAGADKVSVPNMLGGFQIVDSMMSPLVAEMWDQMIFNQGLDVRFREWLADDNPQWVGRTLDELRDTEGRTPVSLHRDGETGYLPKGNEVIRPKDRFIMLASD